MDVLALKDMVRCPTCGGSDVVYTCEPKCCFNHLCADCRTTFQLVTQKTGRVLTTGQSFKAVEPPSGDPIAACASCESLKLGGFEESGSQSVACADCRAILKLAYEEVAAESR